MTTTLIITFTILGMTIFLSFVGAIILAIVMRNNKEYPNKMTLRVYNGGKAVVFNNIRWKFHTSKKYGEIIIAKHKGKKIPMPRFENRWLLSLNGKGSLYCDVTSKDGYFYVNESKDIVKTLGTEKYKEFLKEKYEIVNYESEPFKEMINPIAHEDRSAILMNQDMLNDMIKENTPWWQNPFIAFLAPALFGAIIGIVLAVLGYQFGQDLLSAASPGLETATGGFADTVANTITGGQPPQ